MVRKLGANKELYFWRLKWKIIGGVNPITSYTLNNSQNVFRGKQRASKVKPNIIRDLEVRKNVRLTFSRPKNIMKFKCYVFSGHKQRNKV